MSKYPAMCIGLDPSFKGFGVCIIVQTGSKVQCHITQFKAPYVKKNFLGYCEAGFNVTNQVADFINHHRRSSQPIFVIAEHPPAGGGGFAMSTQPLWALGALMCAKMPAAFRIDYRTAPPSKAGWMAECPRKIGRTDKKRLTKEYAIELLARCNFVVHHRGKCLGDITKLTTKPKKKGDPGRPKAFKMSDNEAEAFLYACLAVEHVYPLTVPVAHRNKHWKLIIDDE